MYSLMEVLDARRMHRIRLNPAMTDVLLLQCVATKRKIACRAKDMYTSAWFSKAKTYAQLQGVPWFILSAKHGLLEPDRVIEPYDESLNDVSAEQRRTWAERVGLALFLAGEWDRVIILAGIAYHKELERLLNQQQQRVEIPMRGLTIGRQLRWLDENTYEMSPATLKTGFFG
jgi:hypothetical protein